MTWWANQEGNSTAAFIDFTNPAAAEWYVKRLKKVQKEGGFDSFKFDGGEIFLLPKVMHMNMNIDLICNKFRS